MRKKLLLIVLLAPLLMCGCSKQKPKECDYCSGLIFYHDSGIFLQSQQWSEYDGKYVHIWCHKIEELESE